MLFSWLRWSFSLILELKLPPQSNEHPSRERQNTHGGQERSQKSSHTARGLTGSASTPWAARTFVICMFVDILYGTLCVTCAARCDRYLYSYLSLCVYVPLNIMHTWLYVHERCRWMWLRQIFTELQSNCSFLCVHAKQLVAGDFILDLSNWYPHEEDERNSKEI